MNNQANELRNRAKELRMLTGGIEAALSSAAFEIMNAAGTIEAQGGTRWHELFGTPERAALTLLDACDNCGQDECSGCQVYELTSGGDLDYDALLEWLGGANDD